MFSPLKGAGPGHGRHPASLTGKKEVEEHAQSIDSHLLALPEEIRA
jgi:hypothetical protein